MKASAVTPLTVLYRHRRSVRGRTSPAVVLYPAAVDEVYADGSTSQGRWQVPATGLRPAPEGSTPSSSGRRGWPVLISTDGDTAVLLACAQDAARAVDAGQLPALPDGVLLDLVAAREIVQPWQEWLDEQDAARREQAERDASMARARKEAVDARARIVAVVDPTLVDPLHTRLRPSDWVALEQLLEAYAAARRPAGD